MSDRAITVRDIADCIGAGLIIVALIFAYACLVRASQRNPR
jgi:hypothetical protein